MRLAIALSFAVLAACRPESTEVAESGGTTEAGSTGDVGTSEGTSVGSSGSAGSAGSSAATGSSSGPGSTTSGGTSSGSTGPGCEPGSDGCACIDGVCDGNLLCIDGECIPPICDAEGYGACPVNGTKVCVDLQNDDLNCGECGNECPILLDEGGCSEGECQPTFSECVPRNGLTCADHCQNLGQACVDWGGGGCAAQSAHWPSGNSDCQDLNTAAPGFEIEYNDCDYQDPWWNTGMMRCCCQ